MFGSCDAVKELKIGACSLQNTPCKNDVTLKAIDKT